MPVIFAGMIVVSTAMKLKAAAEEWVKVTVFWSGKRVPNMDE